MKQPKFVIGQCVRLKVTYVCKGFSDQTVCTIDWAKFYVQGILYGKNNFIYELVTNMEDHVFVRAEEKLIKNV